MLGTLQLSKMLVNLQNKRQHQYLPNYFHLLQSTNWFIQIQAMCMLIKYIDWKTCEILTINWALVRLEKRERYNLLTQITRTARSSEMPVQSNTNRSSAQPHTNFVQMTSASSLIHAISLSRVALTTCSILAMALNISLYAMLQHFHSDANACAHTSSHRWQLWLSCFW